MPSGIYIRTEEHKQKISEGNKGKKRSKQARKNYSLCKLGNKNPIWDKHPSEETKKKMAESHTGEKAYNWKEKVSYSGIHKWIQRNLGKADRCENLKCLNKSQNFDWAKLEDKEYEKKRENFLMLCKSCHIIYDKKINLQLIFIKNYA